MIVEATWTPAFTIGAVGILSYMWPAMDVVLHATVSPNCAQHVPQTVAPSSAASQSSRCRSAIHMRRGSMMSFTHSCGVKGWSSIVAWMPGGERECFRTPAALTSACRVSPQRSQALRSGSTRRCHRIGRIMLPLPRPVLRRPILPPVTRMIPIRTRLYHLTVDLPGEVSFKQSEPEDGAMSQRRRRQVLNSTMRDGRRPPRQLLAAQSGVFLRVDLLCVVAERRNESPGLGQVSWCRTSSWQWKWEPRQGVRSGRCTRASCSANSMRSWRSAVTASFARPTTSSSSWGRCEQPSAWRPGSPATRPRGSGSWSTSARAE